MSENAVLSSTEYSKLLTDLRSIVEKGRQEAFETSGQKLVHTYWFLGKRISNENLSDKAGYREVVLGDLTDVLGMDKGTLLRCIQFFNIYTSAPRGDGIKWAHYKVLIPIQNKQERDYYEKMVIEQRLTRDQLLKAVGEDRYTKELKGNLDVNEITKLKRPMDPMYLYKAKVERVIDGDTLLLHIDLGFGVIKVQRVRLAEIDTPEIKTEKGKEASRYVLEKLGQVDFLMVKTNKIDIYGRYVGHIFYSTKTENKEKIFLEGKYLNQELLDVGMANAI